MVSTPQYCRPGDHDRVSRRLVASDARNQSPRTLKGTVILRSVVAK